MRYQTNGELRASEQFWNRAPFDPLAHKAARGIPHRRRGAHGVLMPDDYCPLPIRCHAQKKMRDLPPDWMAWVNYQPWSKTWPAWTPVRDYLVRFPLEGGDDGSPPLVSHMQVVFVGKETGLMKYARSPLYTLPGFQDYLIAFAMGVLNLDEGWLVNRVVPAFMLSSTFAFRAITNGAADAATEGAEHLATWHAYRDNRPRQTQP